MKPEVRALHILLGRLHLMAAGAIPIDMRDLMLAEDLGEWWRLRQVAGK